MQVISQTRVYRLAVFNVESRNVTETTYTNTETHLNNNSPPITYDHEQTMSISQFPVRQLGS